MRSPAYFKWWCVWGKRLATVGVPVIPRWRGLTRAKELGTTNLKVIANTFGTLRANAREIS